MRVNQKREEMGLIVQANKLWEAAVVNVIRAMVMVLGAMGAMGAMGVVVVMLGLLVEIRFDLSFAPER